MLRGDELLAYGVHELKNGARPYDVIGQARRVVFRYIELHGPQIVAIEAPYLIATERGAVLTTLAKELHERARELGLQVDELSPEVVRTQLMGNPKATKYEVAQYLARKFVMVQPLAPSKPKVTALWLSSRDRYWLHMFDALGLAFSNSQRNSETANCPAALKAE